MQRYISRISLILAACAISGAIAITGIGFLLGACYLAISDIASPALAALTTGLVALVIAGLIVLAVRIGNGRRAAPVKRDESARGESGQPELAAELGRVFGAEMTSCIRTHPKGATAMALIAGFIVGMSPALRSAMQDIGTRKRPD